MSVAPLVLLSMMLLTLSYFLTAYSIFSGRKSISDSITNIFAVSFGIMLSNIYFFSPGYALFVSGLLLGFAAFVAKRIANT